jgi:crotonobetainyl-CoA:carnitine CoA-transferase CaiB-like acyl-CoA transferase
MPSGGVHSIKAARRGTVGAYDGGLARTFRRPGAGQVPAAPVNNLKQALDNPFVAERGRIAEYGPVRMLAGPVVDSAGEAPRNSAPALGADTMLRECGFSAVEIAALRADRVI